MYTYARSQIDLAVVKTCFEIDFFTLQQSYSQNVNHIVQGAMFPEAGLDNVVGHARGAGGLVIVRDLDFFSYCESCMLPFQVKCHVVYVPSGQRVLGLSMLCRVAEVFGRRLQSPRRLVDEVCLALHHGIKPAGVAVMLHCSHINFPNLESTSLDANHQRWAKLLVRSGFGVFEDQSADIWADFSSLVKFKSESTCLSDSSSDWCPSTETMVTKVNERSAHEGMITAIASVLASIGEDPTRKELFKTPARFVKWLMNFKNCNLDTKKLKMNVSPHHANVDSREERKMHTEMNLSVWSQCEHHFLPFYGVVHIGYICPQGSIPIDKSLLQSIVCFYGFKLQVQERLTRQIAETVSSISGGDVIVVAEASHTCMMSRGIHKFGSSTATIALMGLFATDPAAKPSSCRASPIMPFQNHDAYCHSVICIWW